MTISLKHKFVSAVEDGEDNSLVQPSNWNDEHDIEMASARILGRVTEDSGAVEELDAATVRTLINVEDGADVTDATNVAAAGAVMAASTFGTDNLLLRADGSGRGAQASPVVVADTTGALSRVGGGGIPIQGKNTDTATAAGFVGEVVSYSNSSVALTSTIAANIGGISLTAGDWEVSGQVQITLADGATATLVAGTPTTSSASIGGPSARRGKSVFFSTAISTNGFAEFPVATHFVRLSSTTTVYLVAYAIFSGGTCSAAGQIQGRRMA